MGHTGWSRREFEEWLFSRSLDASGDYNQWSGRYEYAHSHIQAMWEGWQASRVAVTREAVAEVVAWPHPNEERQIDIRMLRFDMLPGQKLFCVPEGMQVGSDDPLTSDLPSIPS